MSDTDNDNGLNLDDPDRLPWLETADGYEYDGSASPLKVAGFVLGGLALLAAIVGGIYWMQTNKGGGANGNGEVIAAAEGDYKVRPDDAGGKSFEGEGDAAFAASEGKKTNSVIGKGDTGPAAAKPGAPAPAAAAANTPTPAGAVMVQLGAFGDVNKAGQAWGDLTKKHAALNGLNRKIVEASGEGGRQVFRLQAVTANAAAASALCSKLKASGGNCLIAK